MALVAIMILYVSFVMASLDKVVDDETFDRLRKIEVSYVNFKGEEQYYKLPESNILPNNLLYPIKELRDNLWVYFSKDTINKIRVLLLIRDKKIEEVLLLQESGVDENIIKKQINKIDEMSDRLNNEFEVLDKRRPEGIAVQKQMETAGEFYEFMYQKILNKEKAEKCYE